MDALDLGVLAEQAQGLHADIDRADTRQTRIAAQTVTILEMVGELRNRLGAAALQAAG